MALAVGLGYRSNELEEIAVQELEASRSKLESFNLVYLYRNKGLMSPEPVIAFIKKLLKRKLGRYNYTFAELNQALGGFKLVFSAHNTTMLRKEYFSVDTQPDMLVWKACAASCMIPLVFPALCYNHCLYVDGGLSNSLPYEVFPLEKSLAVYLHKTAPVAVTEDQNPDFVHHLSHIAEAAETATRDKLASAPPRLVVWVGLPIRSIGGILLSDMQHKDLIAYGKFMAMIQMHRRVGLVVCYVAFRHLLGLDHHATQKAEDNSGSTANHASDPRPV